MAKSRGVTRIATRYEQGSVAVQQVSTNAGRTAKKNIVIGVGHAAFGIGAAVTAVTSFAKGLFQ